MNNKFPDRLTEILPKRLQRRFAWHFILEHFLGQNRFNAWMGDKRKRLEQEMLGILKSNGKGRVIPVPEIGNATSIEFGMEFAKHGMPVVFKGQAKGWNACKTWNFEFFRNRYGTDPAILVNHEVYGIRNEIAPLYELITLAELIDQMAQGSMKYARFHPLLDRHPELLDDLNGNWLSERMYGITSNSLTFHVLFMGGQGTSTPIHNAGNDNIFVQIEGKKRWHMWLPDVRYAFQPQANRSPAKSCDLQPHNPDLERWPLYQYVDTMTVDLEPGDLLYVPSYVWHHVENLSDSIGVGTRWTPLKTIIGNDPLLASLELFNTRPSIFRTMFMKGEFDFNKILIESTGENISADAP